MYLPKSKYEVTQALPGQYSREGEDGSYLGPVLTDYRGRMFAGPDPFHTTGKLLSNSDQELGSSRFVMNPGRRIPTESEYKSGKMERYFLQDLRTMKIIEILPKRWIELQEEDLPNYYKIQSCLWLLVGRIEDYQISGHLIEGVKTRNQKTMDQMEIEMPGIISSSVLDDPLEFVKESA